MTTPATGEMTQDGDTVLVPVTTQTVDENGNIVVVGYPSGSGEYFTGTPDTSQDVPAPSPSLGEVPQGGA